MFFFRDSIEIEDIWHVAAIIVKALLFIKTILGF